MAATTIWERWNGIRPDSTFEPAWMNTFNHYAYGAIGDWMYRRMVGLDTDEDGVGFKKIKIQPHVGGGITQAEASYLTPYGKLISGWQVQNGKLLLHAEIPANTTATIYLPATSADLVLEGGKQLSAAKEIRVGNIDQGYLLIQVGSGKYRFSTDWKTQTPKKQQEKK